MYLSSGMYIDSIDIIGKKKTKLIFSPQKKRKKKNYILSCEIDSVHLIRILFRFKIYKNSQQKDHYTACTAKKKGPLLPPEIYHGWPSISMWLSREFAARNSLIYQLKYFLISTCSVQSISDFSGHLPITMLAWCV